MMHRSATRTAGVLLATLTAIGWASTGCSRSGGDTPEVASSSAPGLPPGVVGATAVPTGVPNNAAMRKNVSLTSCRATDGGWQASGNAANPGDKPADYTITVFFTTASGTVIGTGQTKVTAKPHTDQQWSVTGTFTPAPDTRCVLRGVG